MIASYWMANSRLRLSRDPCVFDLLYLDPLDATYEFHDKSQPVQGLVFTYLEQIMQKLC